jgi:ribonucleoside-diphosphate reductase alpha chain
MEITLPTKPLYSVQDENGEVALCTLSAVNLGALDNLDELENITEIIVRALDSLLDYQDYPLKAAEISSKNRRTLGIGVTNLAYYLAKNSVKYSDGSGNELIHKTFEALQYYSLKASNKLAQELGPCPLFSETNYANNVMPIDSYKKDIDAFCNTKLALDWNSLRKDIKATGLRNSTLTALMPCESSSQISNSTNGIEPPRGFVSVKQSKDGILKQVVPEYEKLRNQYELLWDIKNNEGYLQLCAIMQKFVDQSISTNTHYDPSQYDGNRVPMKLFLMDLLKAYKYGIKTLYYHNTRDGSTDQQNTNQPNELATVIDPGDDDCEDGVCKL